MRPPTVARPPGPIAASTVQAFSRRPPDTHFVRGRVLQQLMDGTGRSATGPSSFLSFLLRQTQAWENDVAGTQISITTTQSAPETQGLHAF